MQALTGRPRAARLRAGAIISIFLAGAAHAESASCPQIDLSGGLPPIHDQPQLVLTADHIDATRDGLSKLSGSVHVTEDGREFIGDRLNYDDSTRHLSTDATALFRDHTLSIQSATSDYDLRLGSGVFLDNSYTLRSISGRGHAARIDLLSKQRQATLQDARFTTCAPEHEAWSLTASQIKLDDEAGSGTARNAVLHFQGLPIFYTPYVQFPIDGLRHSGFLFPIVGNTTTNGFDFRWPLYLSLGPNYDATLVPRYLSKRGEQIGGSFRYLFANTEGNVFGEYLPNDQDSGGASRSFLDVRHDGRLTDRIGLDARYGKVSDLNYFSVLGGGLDLTATPYLDRYARLTYQAPTPFKIEALVQDYQLLSLPSAGIAEPYRRLPELRLNALTKNSFRDTRLGFDGTFTNFQRGGSVEGQRFIAVPYLRWERDRAAWFASAQADYNYTAYNLTEVSAGQPEHPKRGLPLFSADGGLRFERLTDSAKLQTLEPRLFYLYVPYRNQDQLPLFDSGLPDFDVPQLYARNRYSGDDRISDANQLTTALTTRLIEPDTGIVRFSGSFGVIDYIHAPRVMLPGFNTPSSGSSDVIGAVDYQISPSWQAAAASEVRPEFDRIVRASVALRYREPEAGEQGRRLDLAYRYRNGLLEQTDTSFSTPITDAWRLAARLRYSLRDGHSLESFVGGQYDTCCWAISGTYRRYLVGGTLNRYSNGFYFQLELKGLSKIGNGFERLLPTDDYGEATPHFEKRH